jgi:hypothetical protein
MRVAIASALAQQTLISIIAWLMKAYLMSVLWGTACILSWIWVPAFVFPRRSAPRELDLVLVHVGTYLIFVVVAAFAGLQRN